VVHVDRFGNLVTSVRAEAVEALGPDAVVHIGGRTLPIVGTYGDLAGEAAGGLIGSGRRLGVAVRAGGAESVLGVGRGTPVRVTRSRRESSRNP
jgi:S-adenosylmethionine hydrolase